MKLSLRTVLFSFFAVVVFHQGAHASLLLEPYLGYLWGKESGAGTAKYTGPSFGARVGFANMGFAIGAEYAGTSLTDDSDPKVDLTSGDLGAFVAFKFPVLVRAYATYIPSPEMKGSVSGGSFTYKSGNLLKVGVGYTGFPLININFEYFSGSYSKLESSGASFDLDPKLTTSGYGISISAPFNFL